MEGKHAGWVNAVTSMVVAFWNCNNIDSSFWNLFHFSLIFRSRKKYISLIKILLKTIHMSWWTGCPPFSPPWWLSTGHQALYGLGYLCYAFHHLHTFCKWQSPWTAISSHLVTGVSTCADAVHAHPTQIFYKRGTPMLTFQLTVGRYTSCTTTLPVDATEHLIHLNSLSPYPFVPRSRSPPKTGLALTIREYLC